MTKSELSELVKNIKDVRGKTEEELARLIEKLEKNVPHPEVSDLIYWNDLAPEKIVEIALSYKPFQL